MDVLGGVLEVLLDLSLGWKLDLVFLLANHLVGALVDDVGVVGDTSTVPGEDLTKVLADERCMLGEK